MIEILGDLRHTCHACGGSCQGFHVKLLAGEAERVEVMGATLGVERPVADGQLREEGGACVFLQPDRRCLIHAKFGLEAKPRICRQFPVLSIRAEEGLRLGLDPGCLTTWRSWRDGPEVPLGDFITTRVELPPEMLPVEETLLDLASVPEASAARLIGTLTGEEPDGDAIPEGFARRWWELLRHAPLASVMDRPGTAALFRDHLRPVVDWIDQMPAPPPPTTLPPEADAFALEVTRRMLFLRLGWRRGPPPAVALVTLGGAVACDWALRDHPDRWGTALSCWSRAIRSEIFWAALFPEPGLLRWLVSR